MEELFQLMMMEIGNIQIFLKLRKMRLILGTLSGIKNNYFLVLSKKSCIASLIKKPIESPALDRSFNWSYSSSSTETLILFKFLLIINNIYISIYYQIDTKTTYEWQYKRKRKEPKEKEYNIYKYIFINT